MLRADRDRRRARRERELLVVDRRRRRTARRAAASCIAATTSSHDVVERRSPERARACSTDSGFDCVVVDLDLPEPRRLRPLDECRAGPALRACRSSSPARRAVARRSRTSSAPGAGDGRCKDVRSAERLLDERRAAPAPPASTSCPTDGRETLERLHTGDGMLAGKKVLIVDDDIRNIFAMTSMLEPHQMQVALGRDRQGRRSRCCRPRPDIDVVLMDIMMPDMDGYDTMRAIRKHAQVPQPADHRADRQGHEGRPREVHRGRRLGLHAKPVDTDQLLAVLRTWLHR